MSDEKEDKSHESLVDRIAAALFTNSYRVAYAIADECKKRWQEAAAEREKEKIEKRLQDENERKAPFDSCVAWFETADGLAAKDRITATYNKDFPWWGANFPTHWQRICRRFPRPGILSDEEVGHYIAATKRTYERQREMRDGLPVYREIHLP